MLSNAYFLAKFRFDTAENEPAKNLQKFANFPNFANFPKFSHRYPAPRPVAQRPTRERAPASGAALAVTRWGQRFQAVPSGAGSTLSPSAIPLQNVARFRLYRHRFLQENTRFAAFFKIYQILKLKFLNFDKISQILRHLPKFFCEFSQKLLIFQTDFFAKI